MAVLYTPHFMQFFDDNGDPLANGKLYTYAAGTTTPKATFTTEAGTISNANPLDLDAAGRATLFIDGAYKFRLETSAGVLVRETDNISSFQTSAAVTGAINWATADSLASASTVNIGAATSNYIIITGTTTITAFDTIAQGAERLLRFNGVLTLTHNATTLILPGGANITTAAGDVMRVISEGSGNWRCTNYQKASGLPVVSGGEVTAGTPLVQDPYVLATTSTQAHGLIAQPNFFKVELECKTAEFNYSVGDKIQLANQAISTSGVNGYQLLADATNTVLITHATDTIGLLNKTARTNTGPITTSRWKLTVTPYLMT